MQTHQSNRSACSLWLFITIWMLSSPVPLELRRITNRVLQARRVRLQYQLMSFLQGQLYFSWNTDRVSHT
jgi:hypothetical protein